MAIQTLAGLGVYLPERVDESSASINISTYTLDASGEKCVLVVQAPKTGNIEGIETYIAAVGNAPDNGIRFSIQAVDGAGDNDGTPIQSVTTAGGTPSAAGWLDPGDLSAVIAVTKGDLLAIVVDTPSFTAADSLSIGGSVTSTDYGFPYGISATSTRQNNVLPIFALRYDDGTYPALLPEAWAVRQVTSVAFDTADTPDEFGGSFEFPFPATLSGVAVQLRPTSGTAGNSYDIVVYDSDGTTVLHTQSVDSDVASTANQFRAQHILFSANVPLSENTKYRVVVKAASATIVVAVAYTVFNSLALMDTVTGGQDVYATQRTDAGAWTDFNNVTDGFRKARISLLLTGFSDGAGGSGGGIRLAGRGGLASGA